MKQKRIVTIQDLSCFGKCSISAALPIISALGIETVVLPTAVLSNHTGNCFNKYTFHSLESEFESIADAWESQKISFDAIHIGYIGSLSLIREVDRFIDKFGKNTTVFVDPAMADEGTIYRGLENGYPDAIKSLCKKADIISPNYTEALILSGYKNINGTVSGERLVNSLTDITENVIVTGVRDGENILTFSGRKNSVSSYSYPFRNGTFYGSGDIFASAFIGFYINGIPLERAAELAAGFVSECIENTLGEKEKYNYGLKFEQKIYRLEKMLSDEMGNKE